MFDPKYSYFDLTDWEFAVVQFVTRHKRAVD